MYSLATRLNNIFFYALLCCLILAIFNISTSYFFFTNPPKINNFKINPNYTLYNNELSKVQHAKSSFDLDVDFTDFINWNNHITFIWITAEYKTGRINKESNKADKEETTLVTVYDKIISRCQLKTHKLVLKDQYFEYPIVDHYRSLAGKEVKYALNFEHMPVIGPIFKSSLPLGSNSIPTKEKKPNIRNIILSEKHYEDIFSDESEEDIDYYKLE